MSNGSRGFSGGDIFSGDWESWHNSAERCHCEVVDVCDGGATPFQMGIWGLPKSDVALFGRDNVTPMVYSVNKLEHNNTVPFLSIHLYAILLNFTSADTIDNTSVHLES